MSVSKEMTWDNFFTPKKYKESFWVFDTKKSLEKLWQIVQDIQ